MPINLLKRLGNGAPTFRLGPPPGVDPNGNTRPQRTDGYNLQSIGRNNRLHLGSTFLFAPLDDEGKPIEDPSTVTQLVAVVPRNYVARTPRDAMIAEFLPEWDARRRANAETHGITWSQLAEQIHYGDSSRAHGLFWNTGYGHYHQALLYAMATIHSYAYLIDDFPQPFLDSCRTSGATVRKAIRDQKMKIYTDPKFCDNNAMGDFFDGAQWAGYGLFHLPVIKGLPFAEVGLLWMDSDEPPGSRPPKLHLDTDSRGKVVPSREFVHPTAWGFFGSIHLCELMRLEGAIADYYFFWAHRLHSYSYECAAAGKIYDAIWNYFIGMVCARCAMSEIVELAAQILHEHGHITGRSYHCRLDSKHRFDLCHFVIEEMWRHAMYAELGLPRTQIGDEEETDQDEDDSTMSNLVGHRLLYSEWSTKFKHSGEVIRGEHASLLDKRHAVRIEWSIPDECATDATEGTFTLNP